MNYIFLELILGATILEIAGDIFFKYWAIKDKSIFLISGIIVYLIAIVIFALALKQDSLTKAISLLSIINFIFVLLVGLFFFKEDITLLQGLGIVFGVIGVILIEI